MQTNNFTYPVVYNCEFNNSYTRTACPPIRQDCQPIDTCGLYFTSPETSYNCTRCETDKEFWIPYQAGDKIPLQVYFPDLVNSDPSSPIWGWRADTNPVTMRAELLDCDGNVISDDVVAFCSDYVVGWANGQSYQTIVVDTALVAGLGLTYFSIKINNFLTDGITEDKVIYTEPFCLVPCNVELPLVQGTFDEGYDCLGFYYGKADPRRPGTPQAWVGSSDFAYYNSMRYWADFRLSGGQVQKNTFGTNIVSKSTIFQNYTFKTTQLTPDYIMCTFLKQHLGAKRFIVDGVEYIASGSVNNRVTDNNMFLWENTVQLECENRFNCF